MGGGPARGQVRLLDHPQRRGWGQPLEDWCPCRVSLDPAPPGSSPRPPLPHSLASRRSPGQRPGRGASSPPAPAPARPDSAVPLQPLLSLDHWVTTRFAGAGDVRVTVQAACGSSVLQDSKVVRVLGESPGGRAACQGSQPHAPVLGGLGPHRRRPQSTPKEGPPPSGLRPHRRSDNHSFCFEDGPPWGQRPAVRQAVGPPPAAPHPQP